MSEKLLMDLLDELKGIRKVLEAIYDLNVESRRRAEEQMKFSNTMMMSMQNEIGNNPAIKDMFNKMALGKEKEDKTDV